MLVSISSIFICLQHDHIAWTKWTTFKSNPISRCSITLQHLFGDTAQYLFLHHTMMFFCSLCKCTTLSLNIHKALFVSLFVKPILIIFLIRIHQLHHIFFNYFAKPFVLFIIHPNVSFSSLPLSRSVCWFIHLWHAPFLMINRLSLFEVSSMYCLLSIKSPPNKANTSIRSINYYPVIHAKHNLSISSSTA